MSFFTRLFGQGGGGTNTSGETETVRRIAARLERLPPERARHLAAFAYVLARVAQADLRITETESERSTDSRARPRAPLRRGGGARGSSSAKSQARLLGGTENYVVTREFREISSREQRVELLECLYAVAAADGTISGQESTEIGKIAEELGFLREESNALRARWRDSLAEFQQLPKATR